MFHRGGPRHRAWDAGAGRSAVWERQVMLTVQGVPVREDAVTILEFDDAGLIRKFRSYYDKLGMMNQNRWARAAASAEPRPRCPSVPSQRRTWSAPSVCHASSPAAGGRPDPGL
jgi:hypothetical protein